MTPAFIVLNLLLAILLAPLLLAAFYLLLLTVAACTHPGRRAIDGRFTGPRTPGARFLILIPAHNEELLLGEVLTQLRGISYPATHTSLCVIADNCDDATAEVARRHGATVWERHDPVHRGKGQALDWAMRERIPAAAIPYDAIVILDADSIVNPDFLWFMNEALAGGHEALQAYYGVQNPMDNWRTSMLTASLAAFHFLRPLGRDRLGLPCGLKGNGMCFSRRLIETYRYPASSVVEDVELAIFFLRRGIRVKFVPGAHVLGQMAVSAGAADTQRARWEGGRLTLLRTQALPLLKEGVRLRDPARIDGAIDLLIPPFAILVAGTFLLAAASAVLWFAARGSVCAAAPLAGAIAMLICAVYVLASLALIRAPAGIYRRLAAAPLFILWKFAVYGRMAIRARRGATGEWVRTERSAMPGLPSPGTPATPHTLLTPSTDGSIEQLDPASLRMKVAIPLDLQSVTETAAAAERMLRAEGWPDVAAGAVQLAITEHGTNIIRHGHPPAGSTIAFQLRLTGPVCRLTFVDQGRPWQAAAPSDAADHLSMDRDREHSRGLGLIHAVAFHVEFFRRHNDNVASFAISRDRSGRNDGETPAR